MSMIYNFYLTFSKSIPDNPFVEIWDSDVCKKRIKEELGLESIKDEVGIYTVISHYAIDDPILALKLLKIACECSMCCYWQVETEKSQGLEVVFKLITEMHKNRFIRRELVHDS